MREVNFLPHEIKDMIFRKKKNITNYGIIGVVVVNIALSINIFNTIVQINLKEKSRNKIESEVFKSSYRGKDLVLDFFKENIVGRFLYEGANLKESTMNLKIIIKDKNEFSKCVKDLETIPKCNIQYLIAPYEENNMVKFEAGLEVKK